jgi:hypothetical protein
LPTEKAEAAVRRVAKIASFMVIVLILTDGLICGLNLVSFSAERSGKSSPSQIGTDGVLALFGATTSGHHERRSIWFAFRNIVEKLLKPTREYGPI